MLVAIIIECGICALLLTLAVISGIFIWPLAIISGIFILPAITSGYLVYGLFSSPLYTAIIIGFIICGLAIPDCSTVTTIGLMMYGQSKVMYGQFKLMYRLFKLSWYAAIRIEIVIYGLFKFTIGFVIYVLANPYFYAAIGSGFVIYGLFKIVYAVITIGIVIYRLFMSSLYAAIGFVKYRLFKSFYAPIGFVKYRLSKFFYDADDADNADDADDGTSDSTSLFSIANRFEKLYSGKVYVGLRIPDVDSGSRQNIDMVLVTIEETVVISVQNLSGLVSVDDEEGWVSTCVNSHKTVRHPNPVVEVKRQVSVLKSYLEQRGCALPEGSISFKVVCSNPDFRAICPDDFPPEVITYDQWIHLEPRPKSMFFGWIKGSFLHAKYDQWVHLEPRPESMLSGWIKGSFLRAKYDQWVHLEPRPKGMFSGWIKGAFLRAKKIMRGSFHQHLDFILNTAPTWDKLELKGNNYMLGEFLKFEGYNDDIQLLRIIRRSKVSHLEISIPDLAPSKLRVVYSLRDYRNEEASASESNEVNVRSNTEVMIQLRNSSKIRKVELSSIISMTLSA